MKTVNVENSEIVMLAEIDNEIYMVGMPRESYEAISILTKNATKKVVKTNRTKRDLHSFLGVLKMAKTATKE